MALLLNHRILQCKLLSALTRTAGNLNWMAPLIRVSTLSLCMQAPMHDPIHARDFKYPLSVSLQSPIVAQINDKYVNGFILARFRTSSLKHPLYLLLLKAIKNLNILNTEKVKHIKNTKYKTLNRKYKYCITCNFDNSNLFNSKIRIFQNFCSVPRILYKNNVKKLGYFEFYFG